MDNDKIKESILKLLDGLDEMNKNNLIYLESTEKVYQTKLKLVAAFAEDSKNVNIESTLMRTELNEAKEVFTIEQNAEFLRKLDSLRIRLAKPMDIL